MNGEKDNKTPSPHEDTLTTIRYYYEESGSNAASLLLEQLEASDAPIKEIKLGYTIVENESTGRLPHQLE